MEVTQPLGPLKRRRPHMYVSVMYLFPTYRENYSFSLQVSLDKLDGLVAKNPSGFSRIRIKAGYFSRISRIRRPKIVRVIEGPTYRSPTNRGTPVHMKMFRMTISEKAFVSWVVQCAQHTMLSYPSSASFLAEMSVRSPRKLLIFII